VNRGQRYTEGPGKPGDPDLSREIESERETACLLMSETMKQRLLAARQRRKESHSRLWFRNLESDPAAFEDLLVDRKGPQALRIVRLLVETHQSRTSTGLSSAGRRDGLSATIQPIRVELLVRCRSVPASGILWAWIFEVRDAEGGGYCARALGHGIFTEAETWELRANVLEAIAVHFEDGPVHPRLVQLHYVKDELIPVEAA